MAKQKNLRFSNPEREARIKYFQEWLDRLRNTDDDTYEKFYGEVFEQVRYSNLSWKDIDLKLREANMLRKKSARVYIKNCIYAFRNGNREDYYNSESLNRAIAILGVKPKHVGTTKEEIEGFERQEWKRKALECLEDIKKGEDMFLVFEDIFSYYLSCGKLTLEDLGITQEDLDLWKKKSYINPSKSYLGVLRHGGIRFKKYIVPLLGCMNLGGLTPEDIGSSEEELDKFRLAYEQK